MDWYIVSMLLVWSCFSAGAQNDGFLLDDGRERLRESDSSGQTTESLLRPLVYIIPMGVTRYLPCDTTGKAVKGKVRWQKLIKRRWKELSAKNELRESQTSVFLAIRNSTVKDSGTYKCVDNQMAFVKAKVKIGHPEAPRDVIARCSHLNCVMSWSEPLYTGYGNPSNVNYIIQHGPKGGPSTRVSVDTTYAVIPLSVGPSQFKIKLWSNTSAGTSVHPHKFKIKIKTEDHRQSFSCKTISNGHYCPLVVNV
jgi:hypothetical protein